MLKRNQVLLNDWLVDIIKNMSKKYDLSFSEVIRVFLCLQIGKMSSYAYPDLDFKYVINKTKRIIKKRIQKNLYLRKNCAQPYQNYILKPEKRLKCGTKKRRKLKKRKRNLNNVTF